MKQIIGLLSFLTILFTANQISAQGRVERFSLHSHALEGNLSGDDPKRSISVYLPPSYSTDTDQRYPVLYMLHGFTDSEGKWFGHDSHWINLPEILNLAIEKGISEEMIVVMPNAYNRFKGSMYSNSITIGDWETFIAHELVGYMDETYRTLPMASKRGLAGHSMGGYGTIRIGMKHPEVFSTLYLLSPCCMENNVNPNAGLRRNTEAVKSIEQIDAQPFFVIATMAMSAAWAPNPNNPPFYYDLPFEAGEDRAEIVAKFNANATLSVIDQYISNLKKLRGLGLDVGNQDWGIRGPTISLHKVLDKYEIDHFFEEYEGDHVNRIAERIETKLLPFFSKIFAE